MYTGIFTPEISIKRQSATFITILSKDFSNMRIAVSRPKSLQEILCQTSIPDLDNENIPDILHQIKDNPT
jgi:hypothetical protein